MQGQKRTLTTDAFGILFSRIFSHPAVLVCKCPYLKTSSVNLSLIWSIGSPAAGN